LAHRSIAIAWQLVALQVSQQAEVCQGKEASRTLVTTDKLMLSRILRFAFLPSLMTGARHFRSFVKRATSDASIAIADPAEGSLDAENSNK